MVNNYGSILWDFELAEKKLSAAWEFVAIVFKEIAQ